MDNELRNETSVSASTEQIGGIVPGVASKQPKNAAPVPSVAMPDFDDPGKSAERESKK